MIYAGGYGVSEGEKVIANLLYSNINMLALLLMAVDTPGMDEKEITKNTYLIQETAKITMRRAGLIDEERNKH